MAHPALEIASVCYRYPNSDWALHSMSLCLDTPALTGIIGPNGAGKSTAVAIGAGLIQPDSGSVRINGQMINEIGREHLARRLAYLPQNVDIRGDFSVREIVALGRHPYNSGLGFANVADIVVINRCLEFTGTAALSERRISTLSGGERRRVLIASVLAQEPEILILDEPTKSLDYRFQSVIFGMLKRLANQGLHIVVTTHDLNFASLYCDRIALLANGRVQTVGRPDAVINEATLAPVFGACLVYLQHPESGGPAVLPGRTSASTAP